MNVHRMTLILVASAVVSGCALTPSGAARRVSPHYTAIGSVEDARAYIYGDRTILEFAESPFFLTIRNENGETVDYEKVGRYYRLYRRYDTFTASVNGRPVKFTAEPLTHTRVFSAPLAAPAANPLHKPKPVKLTADYDADIAALLALSKKQLDEVRQVLKTKTTRYDYDINAKLVEIERGFSTAQSALVQVTFPRYSTTFKPSPRVAWALASIPQNAASINITGYTDSQIAGTNDAKIALGRAVAARDYLVENGVMAEKIKVYSQAESDFIAPNKTKQGRALNRRVEIAIEFVDAYIDNLKT